MAMADVTIMGAGIFGLSIAHSCLLRGAHVQVIDPGGPGAGASGGIVGALAPHVPENWNAKKAFQFDSLIMAEAFWSHVAEISGLSAGYARTGRLQPIADDRAQSLAQARVETARQLWQGKAAWHVVKADGLPLAPLSPTGWVIHDTFSARLHPRKACAALAAAITRSGGRILADGAPQGAVIWTTGVHDLDRISAHRDRAIGGGVKGQAALLRHDARNLPQIFADTVHVVPHEDGTVAIGSTSEREYTDPAATDTLLDDVIARARAAVPQLRAAPVIERWAGLRPRSRSRAPILGAHPLFADQFIANGGFKIGFGMAPKVAQVMADLVLDGRDAIPSEFRPEAAL